MIIFRSLARTEPAGSVLRPLLAPEWLDTRAPSHDEITAWLIGAGEFEAAVTDALGDGAELPGKLERTLREALEAAGSALVMSWRGHRDRAGAHLHQAVRTIATVAARAPHTLRISAPEGYTHYGVFPETYLDAADAMLDALRPRHVAVIGIRSIGTSLSAVVAATARQRGCRTTSYTVRPGGHPYDRRFALSRDLAAQLRKHRDTQFAIVDEGPGRSGSSFASIATALEDIGVDEDHIALLPSWNCSGHGLSNDAARRLFSRLRRYPADFDRTWINGGRLANSIGCGSLIDASAGSWRCHAGREAKHSPVIAAFERRKFIADSESSPRLIKFAGLGAYGQQKLARADTLAAAGFTSPAAQLRHGCIVQPWLRATPIHTQSLTQDDVDTLAEYLAATARLFPAAAANAEDTLAMVDANLAAGADERTAARLRALIAAERHVFAEQPAAVDGRMLPIEWLRHNGRLIKTDALDHHADHFFPGCQNIAWDVAGTSIEFALPPGASERLVSRVAERTGDRLLPLRMPAFTVAYLAYRLGLATTASEMTPGTDDGAAFTAMAQRYRIALQWAATVAA